MESGVELWKHFIALPAIMSSFSSLQATAAGSERLV
jgi:hypothetical protein